MSVLRKIKEILSEEGVKLLILRASRKVFLFLFDIFYFLEVSFYKNICVRGSDFIVQQIIPEDILSQSPDQTPTDVVNNFMEHKFDLLGSGWIKVEYGMQCRGLEKFSYQSKVNPQIDPNGNWLDSILKKSHRRHSKQIWTLIDPNYVPIDWQIDFKSGYRWSEKTWFRNIEYGKIKGADIKVPWELARMQHLTLLAKKYVNDNTSLETKNLLSNEFRNQVLDFIATNPLGYGVNWTCSMDIAIRASNWLLAYDIFCSGGCKFDAEFNRNFSKSIFEHGIHISNNLEWNFGQRGNHYLSNLTGLIFISIYLGKSKLTNKWLAFSTQQLIHEIEYQFNDDGTNFEGSTAYHRLSTELVIYSVFLILGHEKQRLRSLQETYIGWPNRIRTIKKSSLVFNDLKITEDIEIKFSPFSASQIKKMRKMIEFIWHISKPNGSFPQIGDNDSGRLFKLEPHYQLYEFGEIVSNFKNLKGYPDSDKAEIYFFEDVLNVKKFFRTDLKSDKSLHSKNTDLNSTFELKILNSLLGKNSDFLKFLLKSKDIRKSFEAIKNESFEHELKKIIPQNSNSWEFLHNVDLTENMSIFHSKDFGLYIFQSDLLFLSIRGWSGKRIHGGHNHFDQLSIELSIGGRNIIRDPGTYNYTALNHMRWLYRSADSHFSPFSDDLVPKKIKTLSFSKVDMPPIRITLFDKNNFKATYHYNNKICFYELKLNGNKISINSSGLEGDGLGIANEVDPSLGYGVILDRKKIS
jgi:hypothetical protein